MTEISFVSKKVNWNESPWCVDGRNDTNSVSKGPQMLGGSILPVVLYCLSHNLALNEDSFEKAIKEIRSLGAELGVHRGSHMKPEIGLCDCGFSDKLEKIFETANINFDNYIKIIESLTESRIEVPLINMLRDKFNNFMNTISGEKLVALFESEGGKVVNMEGDHAESLCYVNTIVDTTLDISKLYELGFQAFNLDLWVVVKYAEGMDIDIDFAKISSLILYLATHQVLVVDKGKTSLAVKVI